MKWVQPTPVKVPEGLHRQVGGHSLVAKLLTRRGYASPDEAQAFLDPSCYAPSPPKELADLCAGKRCVASAIENGGRILVWGDFDVDGQTSTALLVSALRELGAAPEYHIPLRETESHGVNVPVLKKYLNDGIDLVLTCDTGVASHEALRLADERGVSVVVTDHHDLPSILPEAEAIINPKRLGEDHPLRTLPGVGVAYKFVQALFQNTGLDSTGYLDLVALGIVADIAHLHGDTRYLLQLGLRKLRKTQRPGLRAIMENANITPCQADEEDIGFRIGPRLNALGRLGDANVAVELLTTTDEKRARAIADRLEEKNNKRRLLTDQVYRAAMRKLWEAPELLQYAVLVLFGDTWPAGVIGIVASRLTEEHHKPTILMTGAGGDMARGSARSIEGIDISQAISDQEHLLDSFGGHPMAAGLSLPKSNIDRFRQLVSRSVVEQRDEELVPTVSISQFVSLDALTLELVDEIRRLAPFGPGNEQVVLGCKQLSIKEVHEIGQEKAHLKVVVEDTDGTTREVLYWNATAEDLPDGTFDLALTIADNVFREERSMQLTWKDARPTLQGRKPKKETSNVAVRDCDLVDHRKADDGATVLRKLAKQGVQVWVEGIELPDVEVRTRAELTPCRELALGTLPPSWRLFEHVVRRCEPEKIYIVGLEFGLDNLDAFSRRLLGLAKHALRKEAPVALDHFAAAMAHDPETVKVGLKTLEAQGLIRTSHEKGGIRIRQETSRNDRRSEASLPLRKALGEARAFRAYLARADYETFSEFVKQGNQEG